MARERTVETKSDGGLVEQAEALLRRRQAEAPIHPDGDVSKVDSALQRVSSASVREIDGLIAELRSLREFLFSEGERIHRELTQYTRLSQGAVESARVITETLSKWKPEPDRFRRH